MKKAIFLVATALAVSGLGLAQAKQPLKSDAAKPAFAVDKDHFVKTGMSSNQFEIESSKLAQQKATSDDVKQFADQMIKDHTKAGQDLMAVLKNEGMNPPPTPALSPKHQAMIEQLQAVDGADFQAQYIDMQTMAHMEAVSLFQTYTGMPDDKRIGAFAKKTLPTLEMHNMHVKELASKH